MLPDLFTASDQNSRSFEVPGGLLAVRVRTVIKRPKSFGELIFQEGTSRLVLTDGMHCKGTIEPVQAFLRKSLSETLVPSLPIFPYLKKVVVARNTIIRTMSHSTRKSLSNQLASGVFVK
jgi:hypothetical protein